MEFTVTDVKIIKAPYGTPFIKGIADVTINEDLVFKGIDIWDAGIVDGQEAMCVCFDKNLAIPNFMYKQIREAVYETFIRM